MLKGLLEKEPSKRLTIGAILNHPWLEMRSNRVKCPQGGDVLPFFRGALPHPPHALHISPNPPKAPNKTDKAANKDPIISKILIN